MSEGRSVSGGEVEIPEGDTLTEEEIAAGWRVSPLGDKYREYK
jgi:hypothetical protein